MSARGLAIPWVKKKLDKPVPKDQGNQAKLINQIILMTNLRRFGGEETMPKKATTPCCASPNGKMTFRVEALIPVDHRGQMVLPKELRDRAKIRAGDKLAVITWDQGDEACCLTLIKADSLTEMVKSLLGPLVNEIRAAGTEEER